MIAFEFNVRKAVEAASRFLELAGSPVEIVRLMKLMYLSERKSLELYLQPIFGDAYYSLDHGPIVSRVYNLAKATPSGSASQVALWSDHFEARGFNVVLRQRARAAALSRADLAVIDEVHEQWKAVGTWEMVNRLHQELPEWTDPAGSATPIGIEQLCTALDLGKSEIQTVEEMVQLSSRLSPHA
tara:strand:- start:484 stop:1038 length:555 start_codon:yes stop_codon:yes gene_type:complete